MTVSSFTGSTTSNEVAVVNSRTSASGCLQTTIISCSTFPIQLQARKSFSQTLSNKAKMKRLTVSCSENFPKAETSFFCDESRVVRGERMPKLIKAETSVSLSCSFVSLWDLEENYSLGNCADSGKAHYVFRNY